MARENLFKINVDDDSVIDFEEFILRRESDELAAKRKELSQRLETTLEKTVKKGLLLFLVPFVSLMIGVLCVILTLEGYFEDGTVSPLPVLAAILFFCVAAVTYIVYRRHSKKEELDTDLDSVGNEYTTLNDRSRAELNIPENAPAIEIFTDMYSADDDEKNSVYSNDEATVFEENGILCFYYGSAVIGVPISEIEAVVKSDGSVSFEFWNKDIPYNRGDYMQYKIEKHKVDEYDENYSMTGYYSIRFTHSGTPFEIIVPLYDITPVLAILKTEPITE
ncbi:MAG: hypothetical protein E7643_05215 [Ruminococcaceae bacterium]|nr:hypothetical protein [Oscillospiraceae bacterium]